MKRFAFLPLLLLAFALWPASAAEHSEAVKGAAFFVSLESVFKGLIPINGRASPSPPPVVRTGAVRVLERGGYDWEAEALEALEATQKNLRQAGIGILRGELDLRNSRGFRLEYVEDQALPGLPARALASYASPKTYSDAEDAATDMKRTESNLSAAGRDVIWARVLRQAEAPKNYYYQVDSLPRRQLPVYLSMSGLFSSLAETQRSLSADKLSLRGRGYELLGDALFQDERTRGYFYQIRYRSADLKFRRP